MGASASGATVAVELLLRRCDSAAGRPRPASDSLFGHLVASRAVATYQPETGTFCDREVGSDVASSLIEDSALFVVKWSPQAGEPVVESKLVSQGS